MSFDTLLLALPSFVLVLSVVVFVHEFGHFQTARWLKVAVDTFSIGFGKTLASWRDKQGVEWKLGALPLGGYVKFQDDADVVSSHAAEPITDPTKLAEARAKGLFHAQPIWVRAAVVAAGPLTNFVFAIVAFGVLGMIQGRVDETDYNRSPAMFARIAPDSAAADAGLRPGEIVVAVDGRAVEGGRNGFRALVAASPGQELALSLRGEDGGERVVPVIPRLVEGTGRGLLGVELSVPEADLVITDINNPIDGLGYGARFTWTVLAQTVDFLGGMFSGKSSGSDIAGPLGIFVQSGNVTQQALEASAADESGSWWDAVVLVALNLLQWAAFLSIAVGFVNLLPIPVLDGGHLAFYTIEAIRGGKPLPPVAQEWAFRAGLAMIACLFLFATWNDVSRTLLGASG